MEKVKLGEVLIYEQPTRYIVESDRYDDTFKTPVLTAGKSFLLGYTNETQGIFNELPVIIFDDFTTAIKFVDFPFKVKSSAMKILKPNKEKADIRYLYYKMLTIKTDSEQHKRYWISKYSQIEIPLPPLHIQKAIAAKLDKAQEIIAYNQQLLEKYDQLTQSLFIDMFGDPVKNEKGWKKIKLGSLANISSGSTPSRTNESFYKGNIPWVKTGEVNGKIILDTKEKISQDALKRFSCKLYPKGSLIIAMYGQGKTRGQIGKLGIEATTNQACAVIPPSNKMNYEYLFTLLKFSYEDLRDLGRGGNQPNLNAGLVKNYEVINPPNVLQNEFAKRIEKIEIQKQMAQESLAKSEELFQSLLKESFQQ